MIKHISKEDIKNYPKGQFEGKIVLVDKIEDVKNACEHICSYKFCGIDTERQPSFTKGTQHPVALVQISTPDQVTYLFHILKIGVPKPLIQLLENPNLLKVGVAVKDDRNLIVKYCNHNPKGFVELTGITNDILEIVNKGANALTSILLGFRISKKMQRSNWGVETFSQEQLIYAATDAWICSEIISVLVINNIVDFRTIKKCIIN